MRRIKTKIYYFSLSVGLIAFITLLVIDWKIGLSIFFMIWANNAALEYNKDKENKN